MANRYYMDLAERIAKEGSCVFGAMAAVVGTNELTPLYCTSLHCQPGCTRKKGDCTLESAVFRLLAEVAANVGRLEKEDMDLYLYVADSSGKPRMVTLDDSCWVMLQLAGLSVVYGCEDESHKLVRYNIYDSTHQGNPYWAQVKPEDTMCDPAKAAKLAKVENNDALGTLWPVLLKLPEKTDTRTDNYKIMVDRRNFLQAADGQGYEMSTLEREELDLLERLCFLECVPYVVIKNAEKEFPGLYANDKMESVLNKYRLSCVCGPNDKGETITIFYFVKNGGMSCEWISHRDRLRRDLQRLFFMLSCDEKGSPRYDIIRQLLDNDKASFTIKECTDKESMAALDEICRTYEYRYELNGKPGQVNIRTLESLLLPNYMLEKQ